MIIVTNGMDISVVPKLIDGYYVWGKSHFQYLYVQYLYKYEENISTVVSAKSDNHNMAAYILIFVTPRSAQVQ